MVLKQSLGELVKLVGFPSADTSLSLGLGVMLWNLLS